MKLSAVRITNHSRLEDINIDVRDHLVLVGANDVGKSSILRCLDLLLGTSAAQIYARVSRDDFRDHEEALVVEATLTDLSEDEKGHFPDEVDVDPLSASQSLTIRLEVTLEDGETLQLRRYSPGGGTGRQLTREQLLVFGWKMIGAAQGGVRDFRNERNTALDDILAAIDLGEERDGFDEIAKSFQEKLADSAVLENLRAKLAGQLSKAVPTRVRTGDLSFVSGTVADEDPLSDVRLQLIRDGVPRDMSEQSDGARALFAIALYDLVSEAANLVAIDEPEIHLHPTSQRSLARLLKSGTNQKIIATHSPDMVGAFSPDDIAVVRRGGSVVQPNAGFLDGDNKMLAHWWVKDKLEPLTSSFVLLVEGISDRIVLARVAELTGRDLDRLGVSLTSMGGAGDAVHARTIFGPNGFNVPMRVLIDEDAIAKTAANFEVSEEALEAHGVVISRPNLEAEYVAAIGADELWQRIVASGEFTPNQLALCGASGVGGSRTQSDVAAFCERKTEYKVRATLVVANSLTAAEAGAIVSLNTLLSSMNLDE